MRAFITVLSFWLVGHSAQGQSRLPILDMHLHAHRLADYRGGFSVCANHEPIEYQGLDPKEPITPTRLSQLRCSRPSGRE